MLSPARTCSEGKEPLRVVQSVLRFGSDSDYFYPVIPAQAEIQFGGQGTEDRGQRIGDRVQ
jgi:hypothetical protein